MNPALEKIAKHLRNAEDFTRSRRYSEALIEVDYIFQIDPKNYQGRTLQERIRSLQKKEEEASRNPVVAPLTKEGIYRHLRIADEHFLAGRYDEALIETERVLQTDPDNYQGRSMLDRIRTMQKRADSVTQARTYTQNLTLDKKIELISQYPERSRPVDTAPAVPARARTGRKSIWPRPDESLCTSVFSEHRNVDEEGGDSDSSAGDTIHQESSCRNCSGAYTRARCTSACTPGSATVCSRGTSASACGASEAHAKAG